MNDDKLTIADLNAAIKSLDAMRVEIQPMLDAIKEQEDAIREHVLKTGELHDRVQIRDEYTRVSWDSRALEGFASAHPEILQFRKESTVKRTVVIKKS